MMGDSVQQIFFVSHYTAIPFFQPDRLTIQLIQSTSAWLVDVSAGEINAKKSAEK